MKLLLFITALACFQLGLNTKGYSQASFGESELLHSGWKFNLSDFPNASDSDFNDEKWESIEVPHDWSVKGQLSPTLASCTGYLPGGIAWYRKEIEVPIEKKQERTYLYFEGVYNRSKVYINGKLLGERPNGYISFMYDATDYINYGERNVIAVRVDHSQSADSRWYTGSGIYRDVWLVHSNQIHLANWGVQVFSKDVSAKQATMQISIELANNTSSNEEVTIVNEIISPSGKEVAQKSTKVKLNNNAITATTFDLKIKAPNFWSLENPNLYKLNTKVYNKGKLIDSSVTTTGVRTYTFDPNKGFALNGEWMKVKGVCLHHDAGVLGSAVPSAVWERRLQNLKLLGVNAIRTSHNPQATDLYNICDEIGLLVLNECFDEWEFPKRKWISGWNKGKPGFQGSYDFFEEWGEQDLADMVKRDRNHVSIFAWSIGNEVDYPNDPYSHPVLDGAREGGFTQPIFGGYKKDAPDAMRLGDIANRLATVVKTYDTSRPVTAGLAGVAMSNETEYPSALDIAGYNYTEGRYDKDHKKYPERVIYGSENRHELKAWKATRDKEFIFGQFLWTGIDYLGESGVWPSRGFYSGLLDFGGFTKPRGYYRQSLWSDAPMAYIGTYPTPGMGEGESLKDVWSSLNAEKKNNKKKAPSMDAWAKWNYEEGQSIRVVCYTNSAKAKLLLNDREVGEIKEYDDNTGIMYWDVPFAKGELKVIGMTEANEEVASYSIVSSEQPACIVASSDVKEICKDRGLAQITIQVTDKNGVPVMLSDNEITCEILGPGKLLGLEGSNNSDMGDYTDNKQRVFNGRLMAYVQATGEAGEIKVKFSSPWLKEAVALIKTN